MLALAAEAGTLADAAVAQAGAGRRGRRRTSGRSRWPRRSPRFHFPDDLWARVIYDLVLAIRRGELETGTMVAALVPIYFGRVGSFVIENRNVTTTDAEERVERQARQFELLKPYLVDRWTALDEAEAAGPSDPRGGR